jgi:hypothetical protein
MQSHVTPSDHAVSHFRLFSSTTVTALFGCVLIVIVVMSRLTGCSGPAPLQSEDCQRDALAENEIPDESASVLDFSCACDVSGRHLISWKMGIRARSMDEACGQAARKCHDHYEQRRGPNYVAPPDSFFVPSNPQELCGECECMPG